MNDGQSVTRGLGVLGAVDRVEALIRSERPAGAEDVSVTESQEHRSVGWVGPEDEPVGLWLTVHPDGTSVLHSCDHDGPYGMAMFRDPQGRCTALGILDDGAPPGEWLYFNESGALTARRTFVVVASGREPFVWYHSNGLVHIDAASRAGFMSEYDESGRLLGFGRTIGADGQRTGFWATISEDRERIGCGQLVDSVRTGTWFIAGRDGLWNVLAE